MSTKVQLTASTSIAAICMYWRKYPPPELAWGWMVLCFPAEAVYVRPLQAHEVASLQYRSLSPGVWYGAFNQFTFALIAVSSSMTQLCAELKAAGYIPMLAV